MKMIKGFLIITALGVLLLGLMYGLSPERILNQLFNIEISNVNEAHAFRAIMGLYLGFSLFWLISAFRPPLQQAALLSLVIFMYGIASGRTISLTLDGMPHWFFIGNLLLELIMGTIGLLLLRRIT